MPDAGCDVLRSVGIYEDANPTGVNGATIDEQTSEIAPAPWFTALARFVADL